MNQQLRLSEELFLPIGTQHPRDESRQPHLLNCGRSSVWSRDQPTRKDKEDRSFAAMIWSVKRVTSWSSDLPPSR